jgi:hypothetical protein
VPLAPRWGPVSYKIILGSCTELVATLFGFASVLIGGELILLTKILFWSSYRTGPEIVDK